MTENKPNGILSLPPAEEGPQPCLIIVFDKKTGFFGHKFMGVYSPPGLVNHLEIVKTQLVHHQLAHMQQKPGLVLPDGSPAGF